MAYSLGMLCTVLEIEKYDRFVCEIEDLTQSINIIIQVAPDLKQAIMMQCVRPIARKNAKYVIIMVRGHTSTHFLS